MWAARSWSSRSTAFVRLLRERVEPLRDGAHLGRSLLRVDDVLAGRLIDQVDRLVRQVPLGHVARGEVDGGRERVVADLDPVVVLVARAQPLQDRDRVLLRGLVHVHGGEAPFEGGVLLDAPVLVERGRADGVQLAPRQRGLHQVAGVDGALGCARAHHRVQLVDEEDDAAVALPDLLHDRLQALLELPPELGSGQQRPHVEGA